MKIDIKVGDVLDTEYGCVEVLSYRSYKDISIKFLSTGYIKRVSAYHLRSGKVRDPYHPSIYGVGYFGEGLYTSRDNKLKNKYYSIWEGMMSRCYNTNNSKYNSYGGVGVIVHPDWHNLQTFGKWFDENYREGQELEKDILYSGNKVYSACTCCFVPPDINRVILRKSTKYKKSKLPLGVSLTSSGKYYACFGIKGKTKDLGRYSREDIAHAVYIVNKQSYINSLVAYFYDKGELDVRIKDSLNSWFDLTDHTKLLKENNIEY